MSCHIGTGIAYALHVANRKLRCLLVSRLLLLYALTAVQLMGVIVSQHVCTLLSCPTATQRLGLEARSIRLRGAQVTVYVSCYVEAQNRDAFMAVKQDLLLAFVDCVERNRAELARMRLAVSWLGWCTNAGQCHQTYACRHLSRSCPWLAARQHREPQSTSKNPAWPPASDAIQSLKHSHLPALYCSRHCRQQFFHSALPHHPAACILYGGRGLPHLLNKACDKAPHESCPWAFVCPEHPSARKGDSSMCASLR